MSKPQHIIVIVADSLRYDSVYHEGNPGVPYLENNGIQFNGVRSAGSWTLPATSSLFTGLLPHEHGATTQSRWLHESKTTLAGELKKAGYTTVQITANPVTTDIFNVSKDFDETHTVWSFAVSKHKWFLRMALSLNRPRIRRMLFKPKDIIVSKLSEDIRQGITWAQKTANDTFDKARQILEEKTAKGEKVFLFLNLMETHYPFHIAETFEFYSKGLVGKIREARTLYHFLGQDFLIKDNGFIKQADLDILKKKQQLAWKLIRNDVNDFCQEVHQGKDNLVVFCADHGDNFGDQDWQYHFSNVTDGGNKVPFFWLDHQHKPAETKTHPVSARFMYQDILRAVNVKNDGQTMMEETAENLPVLESYWYNNEGRTMEKYKLNQMAFIEKNQRFVLRGEQWMQAPVGETGVNEPKFQAVEKGFNPLEELKLSADRQKYLEEHVKNYKVFSDKIMSKSKKT